MYAYLFMVSPSVEGLTIPDLLDVSALLGVTPDEYDEKVKALNLLAGEHQYNLPGSVAVVANIQIMQIRARYHFEWIGPLLVKSSARLEHEDLERLLNAQKEAGSLSAFIKRAKY